MPIPSRYAIAIHILTLLQENADVSSEEIALSVGTNPVIIRTLLGQLKRAGLIKIRRGVRGALLTRTPGKITLLDIYRATEGKDSLFLIHERPNPACPVGKKIQKKLDGILGEAQKAMEKKLEGSTLEMLFSRSKKK